jgi:hypothetical protein
MALLASTRRVFAIVAIAIFCPNDNGIVAVVNAQTSLLLWRWCLCPCNNGIIALVFPDFLPSVALDLWKKGRIIGKFGEILIRQTTFTHIKMQVWATHQPAHSLDLFHFCPFFTGPGQRRSGWLYTCP